MNIPSRVNPFGYDNTTPPGYVRAEFLEKCNVQQFIKTDIYINGDTEFECRYRCTDSSSAAVFGAREAWLKNMFELSVDQTSLQLRYGTAYPVNLTYNNSESDQLVSYIGSTILVNGQSFSRTRKSFDVPVAMCIMVCGEPDATVDRNFRGRFYYLKLNTDGNRHDLIPALDPSGVPCMYDTVTRQPFRNSGSGSDFITGFNMDQAESLGSLIPANTTLTVSFPWEASLVQYNSRVEYSLEQAGNKGCTISVQYREPEKDSPIYNKYAECAVVSDITAVNADYKTDLTIDGAWEYALPKLESVPSEAWLFQGSPIKSIDMEFPAMTTCGNMFRDAKQLETARLSFPAITTGTFRGLFEECTAVKSFYVSAPTAKQCVDLLASTKIEEVTPEDLYAPQATDFSFFAQMNNVIKKVSFDFSNTTNLMYAFNRCSNFEEFASDLPNLSDGRMAFALCKLNKESALRILNSIPTWTSGSHPLTLGIHVDHQNDEEVVAAITAAEEKGWTVTVQWTGTPTAQTASTFGLRKPPIYAKLGTVEHPDGTIENFLDWGHYVTNAEENGYQEFASKEEAYEHFNLEIPTEE